MRRRRGLAGWGVGGQTGPTEVGQAAPEGESPRGQDSGGRAGGEAGGSGGEQGEEEGSLRWEGGEEEFGTPGAMGRREGPGAGLCWKVVGWVDVGGTEGAGSGHR